MTRVAIFGAGSIGMRHYKVLQALGKHSVFFTKRTDLEEYRKEESFESSQKNDPFSYCVVANITGDHLKTLNDIQKTEFNGPILMEKPIFSNLPTNEQLQAIKNKNQIFVGYNLRFHPIANDIREKIQKDQFHAARLYVGQHLDFWRKGKKATESYSANSELGGGVLNDLSHELDLVQSLFGKIKSVIGTGGHLSQLDISSEDHYEILIQTEKVSLVSVCLNYCDHLAERKIKLIGSKKTCSYDFLRATFQSCDLDKEIESNSWDFTLDKTFYLQHEEALSGKIQNLCTFDEGLKVCKLIDDIKKSNESRQWVNLNE